MVYYNVPSEFQLTNQEAIKIAVERKGQDVFEYYDGLTFQQGCVTVYKTWSELREETWQ